MGGFTCVKFMMVVFNLIVFLMGACLTATGTWAIVAGTEFLRVIVPFMTEYLKHANVSVLFIIMGSIMVMMGLLGCCGAQKESKCLLITFFSIIVIIWVTQVSAGAAVINLSRFTEITLQEWAKPQLKNQYGKHNAFTNLWNSTMTTLRCCGFSNYTDFSESYYYQQNKPLYPPTCCALPASYPCVEQNAASSHMMGCYKTIVKLVKRNLHIFGAIALGVAFLELIMMGFSVYLYCCLYDQDISK
ncbi:tetraspanin-1 [Paramisgurnus dabryanus]|uniref:tetraspanin-1 n=1 Tax=Paramisgurnus dabryanus TaxID=90735 RepID=UPI0031F39876